MHLHSLTLQALGPFRGEHRIDFAELGASGLFLLEGPTGAGKSTIIDAIVFALYGKVASEEASEDRLRSAYAEPHAETVVDLVLECSSGVYRVRRTPRFERPKRHGLGTTTQQATVKLWRLATPDAPDEGQLLSARLDEAGAELQRIVGLDRTQFVQTIVLPQGEFARFLRADPEQRRGLLQKVFGTAVYEGLQQRLERMRAEVGRALDDARQEVRRAASRFAGAAGLGDEGAEAVLEAAGRADAGADLLSLVRGHVATAQAQASATAATATAARERCAATQGDLDRQRALDAAARRRAALRAEATVLLERQEEHEADVGRRTVARRAQAALGWVEGADRAARAVTRAEADVARARAAAPPSLRDLVDELTEPGVRRKTLTIERDRCTAVRATLLRLTEIEAALPGQHAEVAAGEAAVAAMVAERDRVLAHRAAQPALRDGWLAELAQAHAVASGLGPARESVARGRLRLAAAEGAQLLAGQVAAAERTVHDAAAAAAHAVSRVAELHRARIAGIAGELAAGLVPGESCAVCGSQTHPAPARLAPDHVTVEDVDAAEAARSAADDALSAAAATLAHLRENHREQLAASGGADVPAVTAELRLAEDGVRAAEAAAALEERLTASVAELDAATVQLDEAAGRLAVEIAAEEARLRALGVQVAADEAEVQAAREGAESVGARVAALDERTGHAVTWIDALGRLEDAVNQAAVRDAELATGLMEHGFETPAAVRQAHLPPAQLAELDARVAAYESSVARVAGGLAEPELMALPEVVEVDVDAAAQAHAAADEEATRLTAEAARAAARAEASVGALRDVERALTACAAVERDAGPVVRMANLAAASGGDNARQLTLATYVLARRFADVVAAANARLLTMSDGRYQLVHSSRREDVRSRRTGLAMKVVDHLTECERDPRTLSGGETFYVSLCLALGLADVVTAEAGGIDLGTLFVDEGFGSLDPETLEVVLAELGRLRHGGRVVGVVSHVEALKQAVAERVEVRRLPDGSSTLSVRA